MDCEEVLGMRAVIGSLEGEYRRYKRLGEEAIRQFCPSNRAQKVDLTPHDHSESYSRYWNMCSQPEPCTQCGCRSPGTIIVQNDFPTRGIHQISFYRQRPVESHQDRPLLEVDRSRELFQKCLRHLQIDRVKALSEPAVDLGE